MKKFYTFRAGKNVPRWMFGAKYDEVHRHKNKHGKIVFGCSVVAVRHDDGSNTNLIKASGGKCYIEIKGFNYACLGGINGATGVCIYSDDLMKEHGKGITYKIKHNKGE